MTITKPQAQMLATLACDSRPTGAKQWKPEKVMAEIATLKARGLSLGAIICAVIRCAMDRNVNREECISSPGSHWSDTRIEQAFVPRVLDSNERCSICDKSEPSCRIQSGGRCDQCGDPDSKCGHHEFRSAAMAAKEAEAADPAAMTTAIQALRASIEPTEEPPVKSLAEIEAERPEFAERLAAIQATLPAPPLQEPPPETTEPTVTTTEPAPTEETADA